MKKNILIVGSGGREHALAWKIAQSAQVDKLYVAPGNGGTANLAENVPIAATDFDALVAFAKTKRINLTIIGPEDLLALGIVERFQEAGLKVFGPTTSATRIEASKAFAKTLMQENNIPTAGFKSFTDYAEVKAYIENVALPVVIKASGLAQGKGVVICQTREEAQQTLVDMMVTKVFGGAGMEVVIEEFLTGPEVSVHAFCDGKVAKLFPTAQDHKRIGENDTGLNTGGMGTIAPVPGMARDVMDQVDHSIVQPALRGLELSGSPFVGLLYPGLMITRDSPKVIEFNARFGDPETQSYMRLLKTDLVDIFEACTDGTLSETEIEWHEGFACCIVLASGGYPEKYDKGFPIAGLEEASTVPDVVVFHAGTKIENGSVVTNGGRVLGVTATGGTLQEALDKAYAAVGEISFEGMQYRRDIGKGSLMPSSRM